MIKTSPLAWLKSGLLWRTFFMLAFLLTVSMVAWLASFRIVERGPRVQQLAAQIISIVIITRAALTHSAPELRRELLFDLSSNEGIRIYPLEENDQIAPPTNDALMHDIEKEVRSRLGEQTRFSSRVNDIDGFWISFKIDSDEYWLVLDKERVERNSGIQWLQWGIVALVLSLLGAMFISTLINQPLSRLTAATRAVAQGIQPEPLPESGPTEIEEANRSFNQMVSDLQRIELDRTIILAGISHDLRTPLARMSLEVEMENLSDEARAGMQSDLAQMDSIIDQFLHYAKPTDINSFEKIHLSELLGHIAQTAARQPDMHLQTHIMPNIYVLGNPTELQRVINNLIDNARHYAKKEGESFANIEISCQSVQDKACINIDDRGPGIPEGEIDRMLRPFTRLDVARGQANGSGLGLAIVSRIIQQHNGKLRITNRSSGGLTTRIELPLIS